MMNPRVGPTVRNSGNPPDDRELWRLFLEAEASGSDERAEAALGALFHGLPERAPSAGFRARVMASIGPRSAFARPLVRWSVAAALAAAAASLVFLVPALVALGRAWGLGGGLSALTDSWIFVALRFADAASTWEMFRPLAGAISLAASTPPMLLFLLSQLGIAALALRGLRRLAVPVRSSRHVVPS